MKKRKEDEPDRPRQNKKALHHLKAPFLEQLKARFFVTQACDATGVGRATIYEWREQDPEFRKAMDDVDARLLDIMQSEAVRRAMVGDDKPITIAGKREVIKERSDFLLDRLLRAKHPAFKDNTRVDVHINFVNMLVVKLQEIVQRIVPIKCPHCAGLLPIRQDFSRALESLPVDGAITSIDAG